MLTTILKLAQFVLLLTVAGGIILTATTSMPWLYSGSMPSLLPEETKRTSVLTEAEIESARINLNREEVSLLLSGAGLIVVLLLTNFIFGKSSQIGKAAQFAALFALIASLFSIWIGFRALNEIKWLAMYAIGSEFWMMSRLNGFQLLQMGSFIYISFPLMGIYALSVLIHNLDQDKEVEEAG